MTAIQTMTFEQLNLKIQQQFEKMCQTGILFESSLSGKDVWDIYLGSFSPEENPIFRDPNSSEHNCNNDKNFIKRYGNIVAINSDGKLMTLFDIEVEFPFVNAVTQTAEFLQNATIKEVFVETHDFLNQKTNYEKNTKGQSVYQLGTKISYVRSEEKDAPYNCVEAGKIYTFHHFHVMCPAKFIDQGNKSAEAIQANFRDDKTVFERLMKEVSLDTLELVRDLINQDSILNSAQHSAKLLEIIKLKKEYNKLGESERDNWLWIKSHKLPFAKFRNELLGTLCVELTEGKELNAACAQYNQRIDPTNYKRAVAPITETQKKEAIKTIQNLGYESAFDRELVTLTDINVSEIIHVNNDVEVKTASMFDVVKSAKSTQHKRAEFDKVETVTIDKFMKDILPNTTGIEAFVENRMEGNFVVMHKVKDITAKNLFKWSNTFGWTFKGNLAGKSMIKEATKNAGGNIVAELRCSLLWNDEDTEASVDFDLHCKTPWDEIDYSNKNCYTSKGNLDVDMIHPETIGIENITWKKTPVDGVYQFFVRNFSGNNIGFKTQIEFGGETFDYHYTHPVATQKDVKVATVTVKNGQYSIVHHLPETSSSKNIWGISTGEFHKVSLACLSPNYWGDNNFGNKHYFFMLQGCAATESVKGFHAEFLNSELSEMPTRKFVDIFGNFHQIEPNSKHLAGLGFNSTVRDELILRVSGSHKRLIRVTF